MMAPKPKPASFRDMKQDYFSEWIRRPERTPEEINQVVDFIHKEMAAAPRVPVPRLATCDDYVKAQALLRTMQNILWKRPPEERGKFPFVVERRIEEVEKRMAGMRVKTAAVRQHSEKLREAAFELKVLNALLDTASFRKRDYVDRLRKRELEKARKGKVIPIGRGTHAKKAAARRP